MCVGGDTATFPFYPNFLICQIHIFQKTRVNLAVQGKFKSFILYLTRREKKSKSIQFVLQHGFVEFQNKQKHSWLSFYLFFLMR